MNCKEDLIGTEWACPHCGKAERVTKHGLYHSCENFQIIKPLFKLYGEVN